MSRWLHPLPLKRRFSVGTRESLSTNSNIPDWLGFLIWAGWWMFQNPVDNTRFFLVLLLPTRMCCSAFCCLGGLIASTEIHQAVLTWEDLITLPEGNRIYLRYPDPKSPHRRIPVEGILRETIVIGGQPVRNVKIISQAARLKDVTQTILQRKFDDFEISRTPPSVRQDNRLAKIAPFYKNVIKDFKYPSIFSWSNECLLVTNQSKWKHEVDGIVVSASDDLNRSQTYSIYELLMSSQQIHEEYSGVLLCSPRSHIIVSVKSPLAILDGPEAIKSWEMVQSPNVIIIIDQTEYDDAIQNFLALLSNARIENPVLLPRDIPDSPPPGVEMGIYALG